jgi:hypothetical protein
VPRFDIAGNLKIGVLQAHPDEVCKPFVRPGKDEIAYLLLPHEPEQLSRIYVVLRLLLSRHRYYVTQGRRVVTAFWTLIVCRAVSAVPGSTPLGFLLVTCENDLTASVRVTNVTIHEQIIEHLP